MPDLIERDAAIKLIQPRVKPKTVYGEGYLNAIEHVTELLALMPSANSWIPCSERMPRRFDAVLLAILSKNGYDEPAYYVTIGCMKNGVEFDSFTGDIVDCEKVTHWMPLPSTEGLNET
jgi:hypothetical protein